MTYETKTGKNGRISKTAVMGPAGFELPGSILEDSNIENDLVKRAHELGIWWVQTEEEAIDELAREVSR